jgi:hypothetical protein
MRCRGRWGRRRAAIATAAAGVHDDARDLIRAVEIRIAGLVAFHQLVELAFADAVGGVNLVRQQVGRGTRSGLGQPGRGDEGVERADLGVEIGEVGGGEGSGGGEHGDVRVAHVVDGGAIGQAVGLGHVEQVGRAEIHGVEYIILALRFRPRSHRTSDHRGGAAHGLTGEAFVFRDAGGGAGLFEFLGADRGDGGGEGIMRAGKGDDGLPDGFEAVQNAKHGDKHLRMGLLFYVHSFVWLRLS